jgi:uncharacterized membrane protein
MVRMKLTHSFFYLFLIWNLFLAIIPYAITTYLISKDSINKFILAIWFSIWILFLPNAPYIITDLLHIKIGSDDLLWLDILVVISFASSGLLLFYLSIIDMKIILKNHINKTVLNYGLVFIIFLSSFGVYLGRFLRYNSWEILSQPQHLISDIVNMIVQPLSHLETWLFTIIFGVFLNVGFWIFKSMYSNSEI